MPGTLEIAITPERLDDGAVEERVCFGRFTIEAAFGPLTSGIDHFIGGYRAGPLISGYHAAEWFAWNWWRLRYEPRSTAAGWWRAHKMTAIGEGYAWPNITIYSDGVWTRLLSERSVRADARPFRYLGAHPLQVRSTEFEAAIDVFVGQMEGRLIEHEARDTNLSRLWMELRAERSDPAQAERRRVEALLAHDPDEGGDEADRLIADIEQLGITGIEELAAEKGNGGQALSAVDLWRLADSDGNHGRTGDAVRLQNKPSFYWGHAQAWKVGYDAARALREQEKLGTDPISDQRLADMGGVAVAVLDGTSRAPLAFALDEDNGGSAIVFRSPRPVNRRFELARMIGDRIVPPSTGPLHVATGARTYRQRMQRAFAAELLSPFGAIETFLDGDYSLERQQDAAQHFSVSEQTISTFFLNHHRIARDELDEERGYAA